MGGVHVGVYGSHYSHFRLLILSVGALLKENWYLPRPL